MVIPKFDPDLPADHWLFVLGVVRDFARSKEVDQRNIPIVEVLGLWKADEGQSARDAGTAPTP